MNAEPRGIYAQEHRLLRGARRVGLVSASGSTLTLAAVAALVCWVPVAIALNRAIARQGGSGSVEPFYSYFAMHVMCLLAIPLLIIGICTGMRLLTALLERFETSELVDAAGMADWHRMIHASARTRDLVLPWLFLGTFALMTLMARELPLQQELGVDAHGGFWFLHFVRPLYIALAACVLWRLLIFTLLAVRISRFDLKLVVTHPDRAGGVGFFEVVPLAFVPAILAVSCVFAAQSAHQILYHGASLAQMRIPVAGFSLVTAMLFLAPLLALSPMLRRARREGLKQYAALIARYGRAVHERWIEGRGTGSPMFEAPELGPATDIYDLYSRVRSMRTAPIGVGALACIVLPILLPMLAVVATRVPIGEILRDVLMSVV